MTDADKKFLGQVGIEPRILEDPFPRSLPPHPPGPVISALTEHDAGFLGNLLVTWEAEPEPNFVAPPSITSYLEKTPRGIHDAMEEICTALGIHPVDNSKTLDAVAQELVSMYLDFAVDIEDVVALYTTAPPRTAGQSQPAHFHACIKSQVRASLLAIVSDEHLTHHLIPLVRSEG